ncbi:MAG: outer membrane protein assembly factor BamA [Candidatus Zixiibacteriota bacterium]|nr:MAG: outer membrane protein assembly factor BamA [candidate division Zixibacteria bacterium]
MVIPWRIDNRKKGTVVKMLRITITVLILASLVLCQTSSAAVIGQIEVSGNRTVNQSLILNMSGLVVGAELRPATIQEAIQRIYAMDLFSDIQIEGVEQEDAVKLVIVVKEFPRVRQIDISGNRKIKKQDIEEKIDITAGKVISQVDVKSAVDGIKSLYNEKGYLSAQIRSELIQTDTPGEVILSLEIDEGRKVKIKKIYVEGNQAFKASKIRKQMKNKQDSWWRGGEFDPDQFEDDKEAIIEFYKKKGYLDAQIVSDSVWYGPDKKDLFIQINLTEGQKYKFGKVSWEGNKLFASDKLEKLVKFKEGDVYSQEKYDETLGDIYFLYQEDGHLYTQVEDKTTTRGDVVNVTYGITEGVPANIRYIDIRGNTKTKEKVIRRELSLVPGQRFRRSFLMRSLRDVNYLNYFSNVEPDYEVLPNGDIDLIIKVEEKPTGQIMFGAGYSARDKLVGNIGLGIPNFRGNGQNLSLNWDFGKRRQTIELSFTEPWFRGRPTSVGFDVYQVNQKWYDDFAEEKKGFGLRLGRRLSWPDDYFRVYWRYRWEQIAYDEFEPIAFLEDTATGGIDTVYHFLKDLDWPRNSATTSLTIVRDSRDLPQFATKGSVISWRTELGVELLGGDFSYHKHTFEASHFRKLFWNLVLAGHLKTGVLDGRDRESSGIYTERFSPGGTDPDGMIRGYSDGDVGPTGASGVALRGRSVLVYNVELQYPLVEQQMYLLAFADAGNAWLSGRAMKPFALEHKSDRDLFRSMGLGVRLMIPGMGLIGFDFGFGFDYPDEGEWRPHFQFGTTF